MKALLITILSLMWVSAKEAKVHIKESFEIRENNDIFAPEKLKNYIIEKGIKHPEIVYAQAILETGHFKSVIFKENNNLFGMKYIHDCNCSINRKNARKTTAIGSKYNHAVYRNWKESVDDYLLWQQMFKITPIEEEEDYLKLLQDKYSESPRYAKVIKKLINK